METIQLDIKSSLDTQSFYYLDHQIDNWITILLTNISKERIIIEAGTLIQMKALFGQEDNCLTQIENKGKIAFYFNNKKDVKTYVYEEYIESEFLETITIESNESYPLQVHGIYPLMNDCDTTFTVGLLYEGKIIKRTCTFSRKKKSYAITSFAFGEIPMPGGILTMCWQVNGAKQITINGVDVSDKTSYEMILQTKTTIILKCLDECNNILQQIDTTEPLKVQLGMFGLYYQLNWSHMIKECFWDIENSTGVTVNQQSSSAKVDSYQSDGPIYIEANGYPSSFILEIGIDAILEMPYTVKIIFTADCFRWFVTNNGDVFINEKKVDSVGQISYKEIEEIVFNVFQDMAMPVFKATIKKFHKSYIGGHKVYVK